MITAAVSRSKSYVYALPSVRYRVAFSTAATVRAFAFFSKSTVYPFWFFHINQLFEDDAQVSDRMKRYMEDVSPIAGLQLTDVVWDELVAELRSQALQRGLTTLYQRIFFDSGTEQERWLARGASLVELCRLKEQAQRQNDWLLTKWLDQAINAAESDLVTSRAAAQVANTCAALASQLSSFSLDGELTVYWGLFTDGVHLRRGYVAYGSQVRWTFLGTEFAAAQQALITVNDRFHLGSMST